MASESFALRDIERRLRYLETLGGVSAALHAATHAAAGTDPVAITEGQVAGLTADLAAKAGTAVVTAVANGLAPASGGGTLNFLRADGTWQAPASGGGATVKEALVNVVAPAAYQAKVVVADAAVTAASKIVVGWGAVVDADANSPEMDDVSFSAVPAAGSFTVLLSSKTDRLLGIFRLNYVTG